MYDGTRFKLARLAVGSAGCVLASYTAFSYMARHVRASGLEMAHVTRQASCTPGARAAAGPARGPGAAESREQAREDVVVVTGSSGLIGSALIRHLAGRYRLVGFDNPGPPYPPPAAESLEVDLTSDTAMRGALDHLRHHHGDHIASVLHLAAYYDFSGAPSPRYETITVGGTARLLGGLRAGGFHVEQFVFSSTMLVHRPAEPGQRIAEDSPIEPTWPYPASKVRTEQLIRAEHGQIPVVLLRIAGVYDDVGHSIPLARQIQRIYERQLTSRLYPGDTAHGQAFVHLEDLVDAVGRVVERRAALPPELPVLIGEPETLSYDELQHTLGRLIHGEPWETRQIPKAVARTGAWLQDALPLGEEPFIKPWMVDRADDHYALDITRARTLLGWEPNHSLRATLPTMVAALNADPLGWYRANELDPPAWLEQSAGGHAREGSRAV